MNDKVSFGYRFKFIKIKESRYLSHLDITRIVFRALLRAGFDLVYSQGFNPKPKLSFSNPTPLGLDSFAEYCDMFLEERLRVTTAARSINRQLGKTLKVIEIKEIQGKAKSLMSAIDLIYYESLISRKDGTIPGPGQISGILELKEDERFKGSIYSIKASTDESKNNILLKLLGYAKILKATENKVFKFNYFFDCLKDMAEDGGLTVHRFSKKECYILKEGKLFNPIEVL